MTLFALTTENNIVALLRLHLLMTFYSCCEKKRDHDFTCFGRLKIILLLLLRLHVNDICNCCEKKRNHDFIWFQQLEIVLLLLLRLYLLMTFWSCCEKKTKSRLTRRWTRTQKGSGRWRSLHPFAPVSLALGF